MNPKQSPEANILDTLSSGSVTVSFQEGPHTARSWLPVVIVRGESAARQGEAILYRTPTTRTAIQMDRIISTPSSSANPIAGAASVCPPDPSKPLNIVHHHLRCPVSSSSKLAEGLREDDTGAPPSFSRGALLLPHDAARIELVLLPLHCRKQGVEPCVRITAREHVLNRGSDSRTGRYRLAVWATGRRGSAPGRGTVTPVGCWDVLAGSRRWHSSRRRELADALSDLSLE
jgi:hypothetical protein